MSEPRPEPCRGAAEGAPAPTEEGSSAERPTLLALSDPSAPEVALEPAARWRVWMDQTKLKWANRCLPLLVANEAGWILRNPFTFTARWSGEDSSTAVTLDFSQAPSWPAIHSHFGYGIVTWSIPFLFRTSPGWNLLARGPANHPKDGACALEGIVETDWSVATFTMNWKLTRPDHPVTFEKGEPYCMIVPQRRGDLESFQPRLGSVADFPATRDAMNQWAERRHQLSVRKFLGEHALDFQESIAEWEAEYFRGRSSDGSEFSEHQTKLRLEPFTTQETRRPAPGPRKGSN